MNVSQLNDQLSEMSSQLMVKEKELTKLKEDHKLLVKQFRERKDKKRRETIPQVIYASSYLLYSHVTTGSPDPAGVVRQW